jgi:hypothetical protein
VRHRRNLFRGVSDPAEICLEGYQTPQNKCWQNPRKFSVVWYPGEICLEGSDTPRKFFQRGMRPRRNLFTPLACSWPHITMSKRFESLPVPLKGPFLKIVCMYNPHYPRPKGSMLKESLAQNFVFFRGVSDPADQLSNSNISANSKPNSKMM